eukprot:CAMPEP_0171392768 /NCGR_PEP_ID=MMETSP0880-20121228/2204_1 /TAXON_ID=67004 /ORGANISM="Thalassiosira weissflogii, Strain CCMP1336" /LENGTH=89 /DNA_ID=CAMNT_0011905763 /DNA_START=245 /DNA_END=511 /DNA_ORIENTATION=+
MKYPPVGFFVVGAVVGANVFTIGVIIDGEDVGDNVGLRVGESVGLKVGSRVPITATGLPVGFDVGKKVGLKVGSNVLNPSPFHFLIGDA